MVKNSCRQGHVYLAEPIAIDAPGCCLTVETSAHRATERKLYFLMDFQTRTDPDLQKVVEAVHNGGICPAISAEAGYQTGVVRENADKQRRTDPRTQSCDSAHGSPTFAA